MQAPPETVAELRAREPITHHAPNGYQREAIEQLLVDDYFEVGASGRLYERERVIETVVDRFERDDPAVAGEVEEFAVREVCSDVYVATYVLRQPDGHAVRTSRRVTVWSHNDGEWRVVYHQGTMVDG